MWRKRKDTTRKRRGRLGAFLDEASEFEGKYTCSGTVMLEGKFKGEIAAADTLIIGEQAIVHANVSATTLVVQGELVGSVFVRERLELRKGARLLGDVVAPVIAMEEGAVHEGHCRMAQPAREEAPLALVASGDG